MIEFRKEAFDEAIGEFAPMLNSYWNKTPQNKDALPLDMDWDAYRTMEEQGVLHITTGREDGKLIAAVLYLIIKHPHHRTVTFANADIFAVDVAYRNRGIGAALFRAAESLLIGLGVSRIINQYREDYNVTPIFTRLGFRCIERSYLKVVA